MASASSKVLSLLSVILCVWINTLSASASCRKTPIIFAFGDSNTDTGGSSVVFGEPLRFPEGRLFFQQPTGRKCDGRLIIDLLWFGDPFLPCNDKNAKTLCPVGARYVSWDGTHYTEEANMFVASRILSTNFSRPPLDFEFFCN